MVSCDTSPVIDEQESRARALELVRTLEVNGLTLLAAAVARSVLPASGPMAGRECQIFVRDQWRLAPGRRGGHGYGGTVATTHLDETRGVASRLMRQDP
jgi:hypothetical protein